MTRRVSLFLLLAVATAAAADDTPDPAAAGPRPDDHAPIGVMGEHTHGKGEWMVSYRYMRMNMEPNRIGTDDVSAASQLLSGGGTYGAVPTVMTMDMHMFGLMYGATDRLTLMAMLPVLSLSMDHITAMGGAFTTDSTGVGDFGLSTLTSLWRNDRHQLILNFGMTFPTGSIDRKDVTPASAPNSQLLPYPMQLGSGTWDFKPGLTYNGEARSFSWGGQLMGTLRAGRNDQDYSLGHDYLLTGWSAWKALDWASLSARVEWRQWFDIDGMDSRLMPPPGSPFPTAGDFIPTADPDLRAGRRLDIGPGVNFVVPKGGFENLRFAVEALFPVYQNLDGPQLATDWTVIAGTQYSW